MERNIVNSLESSPVKSMRGVLMMLGATAAMCDVKAYLVGGTVRDALLGIESQELTPDIVIVGDSKTFARACTARLATARLVSVSRHRTACIEIDGQRVELADARKESYNPFGSLPETYPVDDIADDLPRRDFTVNAMAVRLLPIGFGECHDPFGGLDDCANSILRVIHNASFIEDPTRILRGIRLSARCGLEIEPCTADEMRDAQPHLRHFKQESPERLFNEFSKWFEPHEHLEAILVNAHGLGILEAIGLSNPNLQNARHAGTGPANRDSRFAATLQCFDSEQLVQMKSALPFPRAWRDIVTQTVEFRRRIESTDWFRLPRSSAARILRRYDERVVLATVGVACNADLQRLLRRVNITARSTKPSLNGEDVELLGAERGPMIGELLDRIVDLRIDGLITSVADEIDYVESRLRSRS